METPALRVYGGVEGDHRRADRHGQLIEAGLDLLGAAGADAALTVRGVCKHAGLAARYFYESFADRDALAVAVFDHVVQTLAATTLEAVAAAPAEARAKVRAGLAALVRAVAEDPRKGRLLFATTLTSAPLAERRLESSLLFADLLVGQTQEFFGIDGGDQLGLTSQFAVGGLAQTLTSWLNGVVDVDEETLVAHCTEVFLAIAARADWAGGS
jgi:AcrR family transcriptional regulator